MVMEQFSSYQIGNMLNVSRQAVNQWIDKGYINSHRTPGGHRRVRREDLLAFLNSREIPIPEELLVGGATVTQAPARLHLVHVDNDREFAMNLDRALGALVPEAQVQTYDNAMDALVGIGADSPDVLILDPDLAELDGAELCRRLHRNAHTRSMRIAFVTAADCAEVRAATQGIRVVDCFSKSSPVSEIARSLAEAVGFPREAVG